MSARLYIRLIILFLFAVSIQTSFAQSKTAGAKKSAPAKAKIATKTAVKAPTEIPAEPVIPEMQEFPPAGEPTAFYPDNILYLETGTPIFLETQNEVDSKFLEEGKMVCLYVKYPVKVQGRVVIPAGREAWCRVNRLVRPKGNGRAGILEIEPMHIMTNDGQMVVLSGNPVSAYGDDREILSQVVGMGGSAVSEKMINHYQQRQMNRQMELDALIAQQQQQQLDQQQQQQQLAIQQQYLYNQDLQSRQMQMIQQQQLMQQAQMNPRRPIVVMPVAQENAMPPARSRSTMANIGQAAAQTAPAILGAAANPALLGVATAVGIISPFVSILIKGKRAKLPKGYTMKTFVSYGVVMDTGSGW